MRLFYVVTFFLVFASVATATSIFNMNSNTNTVNIGDNAHTGSIVIDGKVVSGNNQGDFIEGSGKEQSDNRRIDDFEKIKINGGFNVSYRQGNATSLTITGDDNIIPFVESVVKNGRLILSINKSYSQTMPLNVVLQSKHLQDLVVLGSSDADLNAINADKFLLDLSGTGKVTATGKVGDLTVKVLGAGDVGIKGLIADSAHISLLGSGDITVTVRNSLSASIIGSGDVTYYGNPKNVNRQIIGSGNLVSAD